MEFIRFLGNIIAFLTVIFVCYYGYKIFKSKKYFSKKAILILLIAVVGISVASPMINVKSKNEISTKSHKKITSFSRSISEPSKNESSQSTSKNSNTFQNNAEANKTNSDIQFQKSINNLNTGFAKSASYNNKTHTVTWIGFDDWKTWNNSELQNVLDKIQVVTLKQAIKWDIYGPKIVVKLSDDTMIATRQIGGEFELQ